MPGMSKKSDGLIGAASIETRTSSWPRTGSVTVLSSMTSEGSPKATSCNCHITNPFRSGAKTISLGRPAAVHPQAVADDERGLAGGEPNHGAGDFLRSADSADGVRARDSRFIFG